MQGTTTSCDRRNSQVPANTAILTVSLRDLSSYSDSGVVVVVVVVVIVIVVVRPVTFQPENKRTMLR